MGKACGSCLARKGTRSFLRILLLITQWQELGNIAVPTSKKPGKCSLASRQTQPNQAICDMGEWENKYWEKVYNHTFLFHCNGTVVSAGRALGPRA